MIGGGASVVTGTAFEALVLLYRHVQAEHGLSAAPEPKVPPALLPLADRFFRGDIALGMNVVPLAHTHGWHTLADLTAGLDAYAPDQLAKAMLRAPDATAADHARRENEVGRVLAGEAPREPLLAALNRELFDTSAVEALLDDPTTAAREFTTLIRRYAQSVTADDLHEPLLADAATEIRALLDESPLDTAARRLFPQLRFHRLDDFDSVVLIPSAAIAPFLSTRVTAPDQALIVFPVPSGEADLVAALKALAHPLRLQILRIADRAPITGHDLARTLGVTEATVHHHTSLLRAAGLITSTREAHRVNLQAVPNALPHLFTHLIAHISPPERG
ncbi:ArsR/SmtB family transcription factor [Spirillospora sp. CA-294931]|uniref:ArsR/SmtB family transcription factor n=1 Tax=Spirillospora sp. CA-294931 TaxID=3240042 RepID=UPI003D910414